MKNNNTFYSNPKQAVLPMLIQEIPEVLKMKKRTTWFTRVLTLMMLACLFTGSILASAKEEGAGTVAEVSAAEPESEKTEEESSVFEPFFRIDRDDADAW